MNELIAQFIGLMGVAALIAMLINLLKMVGVIKDGDAQKWSAGLNLAALIAFIVLRTFYPAIDIAGLDEAAQAVATIGAVVLTYLAQILGAGISYKIVRGLPGIGFSHQLRIDAENEAKWLTDEPL